MSKLKLPTLLCITDNPSVRFWIKKHLDDQFFIIDASKRGAAIAAAESASLDFIIVDSELEDCDAIELCAELKQILRSLSPILLITGRLKRSFLDAAMEAGVTDFLNNQLDPEELEMRIATIRKGQHLREKTQNLSGTLTQKREDYSSDYLKKRVLLHNQALNVLKEAKREGVPITALIIRIDHFDELQSRIGFTLSEEILSPFAELLQKFLGKTNLLIPSGEGRFIALLKHATPEKARIVAEEIRKGVAKTPVKNEKLTVSIAVSSLEGTETDFNRMVDSSFKALKTAQDHIISLDDKETP